MSCDLGLGWDGDGGREVCAEVCAEVRTLGRGPRVFVHTFVFSLPGLCLPCPLYFLYL